MLQQLSPLPQRLFPLSGPLTPGNNAFSCIYDNSWRKKDAPAAGNADRHGNSTRLHGKRGGLILTRANMMRETFRGSAHVLGESPAARSKADFRGEKISRRAGGALRLFDCAGYEVEKMGRSFANHLQNPLT